MIDQSERRYIIYRSTSKKEVYMETQPMYYTSIHKLISSNILHYMSITKRRRECYPRDQKFRISLKFLNFERKITKFSVKFLKLIFELCTVFDRQNGIVTQAYVYFYSIISIIGLALQNDAVIFRKFCGKLDIFLHQLTSY